MLGEGGGVKRTTNERNLKRRECGVRKRTALMKYERRENVIHGDSLL